MDLRIFVEPQQGATFADQLAVAQATEELGFDAFFRSDHFLVMGDGDGLPGPTDSWVTLGAIARETSRIRLGTLVTSMTFRYPGMLAVQVAQVDEMSGGRVELGLGAGWFEAEHRAYGVPFPAKRFGPFTEQLEILTGLWGTPLGETFDYDGEHFQIAQSPGLPKPVQHDPLHPERAGVPIIIGGGGPKRTPALAARFANEYNASFPAKSAIPGLFERVREACTAHGRDPGSLTYSVALVLCGGKDEAEFSRRAAAIGREPAELREHGVAGTVTEMVDTISTLEEQGVERLYLQVLDQKDLDHLDLVAREVVPQLR